MGDLANEIKAIDSVAQSTSTESVICARPGADASEQTTTLANPMEQALVADMRGILSGDLAAVPGFVGALLGYFEDGMRPGMPTAELSQHLARKASFVLGELHALFHETRTGEQQSQALEGVAPAPPRWFDAMLGACLLTSAWKLPAAVGIIELARRWHIAPSNVASFLVGFFFTLVPMFATAPMTDKTGEKTIAAVALDVALVGGVWYTHASRGVASTCGMYAVSFCAVARSLL